MKGETGVIVAYVLGIGTLWGYALFVLLTGRAVWRRHRDKGRET